jgi:hypothetical protein
MKVPAEQPQQEKKDENEKDRKLMVYSVIVKKKKGVKMCEICEKFMCPSCYDNFQIKF